MKIPLLLTHFSLIGFYPSYRDVPWKELLAQAQDSLECVVYYWDKWVEQHKAELNNFLQKPNTQITFIFADNGDSTLEKEILRLFPANSAVDLAHKITQTYSPLLTLDATKIAVFKVPYLLHYSLQIIDDSIAVLSLFDLHRVASIDSPAFVIDLEKSSEVKKFFAKELDGMKQNGKKITL